MADTNKQPPRAQPPAKEPLQEPSTPAPAAPEDDNRAVWVRTPEGDLAQTNAGMAKAWGSKVVPDEDALAEKEEREKAPPEPRFYVRTNDGQLRPVSDGDVEKAKGWGLTLLSAAEARTEQRPVYVRAKDGTVSQTNAAWAKKWGAEVLDDKEGQRLMAQQQEAEEGVPAGPANPLRNPGAAFAQAFVTKAAPRQPTAQEMTSLQDFATPPPAQPPAPTATARKGGAATGPAAELVAEAGMPLPGPRIVGERTGGPTDGAGTRYYTVQEGDGSTREVRSGPGQPGLPLAMLRDWRAQQRAEDEAAEAERLANDPARMTREQRAQWLSSLPERERLEYLSRQGGQGAAAAQAALEKLGPAPAQPAGPRLTRDAFRQVPPPSGTSPASSAPPLAGAPGAPPGMPSDSASASATAAPEGFRPARVPGAASAMEKAFSLQQQAVGEQAALAAQQAEAEAARQEAELRATEQRVAQSQAREAERQQKMQQQMEKVIATLEETTKSAGEVDPNRWWKSRTTGQRVLAGIASFMAGFGGGPDPIRQVIADDIALQREALDRRQANAKQAAQNQMTLLSLMRERFGDEVAAEKAAEAAALGLAQQRAQRLAAVAAGDGAKAKAAELVAQLEVTKQERLADLRLRFGQLALQQEEAGLRRSAFQLDLMARAGKMGALKDSQVRADTPDDLLSPAQQEKFITGLGLARDSEAAKVVRKKMGSFGKVLRGIDTLIAFRERYGSEKLPSEQLRNAKTTASLLQLAIKEELNLGSLDAGSQQMLNTILSDNPGEYGYYLGSLKSLRDFVENGFYSDVTPYMQTPVSPKGVEVRK